MKSPIIRAARSRELKNVRTIEMDCMSVRLQSLGTALRLRSEPVRVDRMMGRLRGYVEVHLDPNRSIPISASNAAFPEAAGRMVSEIIVAQLMLLDVPVANRQTVVIMREVRNEKDGNVAIFWNYAEDKEERR